MAAASMVWGWVVYLQGGRWEWARIKSAPGNAVMSTHIMSIIESRRSELVIEAHGHRRLPTQQTHPFCHLLCPTIAHNVTISDRCFLRSALSSQFEQLNNMLQDLRDGLLKKVRLGKNWSRPISKAITQFTSYCTSKHKFRRWEFNKQH